MKNKDDDLIVLSEGSTDAWGFPSLPKGEKAPTEKGGDRYCTGICSGSGGFSQSSEKGGLTRRGKKVY